MSTSIGNIYVPCVDVTGEVVGQVVVNIMVEVRVSVVVIPEINILLSQ